MPGPRRCLGDAHPRPRQLPLAPGLAVPILGACPPMAEAHPGCLLELSVGGAAEGSPLGLMSSSWQNFRMSLCPCQ